MSRPTYYRAAFHNGTFGPARTTQEWAADAVNAEHVSSCLPTALRVDDDLRLWSYISGERTLVGEIVECSLVEAAVAAASRAA